MIKLAIIEDIESIRKGIAAYLMAQPEFEVVASCASVEEFIEIAEEISDPNVILTDIGLPGMSGIEGIKLFKRKFPRTEIIILTVFQDADSIYRALCAGATGYLLKSTSILEVKESIISITLGDVPMSKSVARKVLNHFNPKRTYNAKENLTAKEEQVLLFLVEGLSYKHIADRMGVSLETTRTHIKNIYKKLQVNSKSEVVKLVLGNKNQSGK